MMEIDITSQPPRPRAILRDCQVGDVVKLGVNYYRLLVYEGYNGETRYLYSLSSARLYPLYESRSPDTPVIMVKNCKFTGEEV